MARIDLVITDSSGGILKLDCLRVKLATVHAWKRVEDTGGASGGLGAETTQYVLQIVKTRDQALIAHFPLESVA